MNFIIIGHFAVDNVIRFQKRNKPTLGGSVAYCSLSLAKYTQRCQISIISVIGTSNFDKDLLNSLKEQNINLDFIQWKEINNTNFILEYHDHSRHLTLKSRGPELEIKDFPQNSKVGKPDGIILAPLCNEISFDYVKKLVKKFPETYFGIDLQGFIRKIGEDGGVSLEDDDDKIKIIHKIIDLLGEKLVLKGSEEEMKILTSAENLNEIEDYFKKPIFKGLYLTTLGEKGSLVVKYNQDTLKIPAFKPKKVIDETGAGDVYLGIFLYEFIRSKKSWKEIKNCAYLASAAASFDVEKKGTNGFKSKGKVNKRVKQKHFITG
ncbi:MAG: putative sugar kinase [Promethearchaeota archaeon]|nr:MAG: putative sugar kinase [Candidatus Lokiarchaeota archaeon]